MAPFAFIIGICHSCRRIDLSPFLAESSQAMQFIEMTGKELMDAMRDDELTAEDLKRSNIIETSIVRINRQGDIEVRRPDGWDLVGGLIGEFENRIAKCCGRTWA